MTNAKWKVTGLGGIFLKLDDRDGTARWLTEKLDLPTESWGRMFPWRAPDSDAEGYTVLGLFEPRSDYFAGPFMLNLRVDDLDAALVDLEARGVTILKRLPPDENGKFAHVAGPGGLVIELFQPAP